MPCLPLRAAVNVIARPRLHSFRGFLRRGLLEQSVAERLVRAAIAAGFLWLAIWWALT